MTGRLPLTDTNGEVRELTEEDFRDAKPFSSLPAPLQAKLHGIQRGRPKASVTKERITIRLSHDVVSTFRATGGGWQTRLDEALQDWLKTHSPA